MSSIERLLRIASVSAATLFLLAAGCIMRPPDDSDEPPTVVGDAGTRTDAMSGTGDREDRSSGDEHEESNDGSSRDDSSENDDSEDYSGPTDGLSDAECRQYFRQEFGQNDYLTSLKKWENVDSNDPRAHICEEGDKCAHHDLHFRTDGTYSQLFRVLEEFDPLDFDSPTTYGSCHEGSYEVTGCNEIQFETCDGDGYSGSWWVYQFPNQDRRLLILTAPFRVKDQVLEYSAVFEEINQPDTFDEGTCFAMKDCSG